MVVCGDAFAHRADAVDEMLRAAVLQVVAVDAGDHDVAQLKRAIVSARCARLLGVGRRAAGRARRRRTGSGACRCRRGS